ncbi:MAG: MBL fold metallo-hydrolase, partial [Bacteroidales bacterium]|nr:MBL fold metallo-hydrolase [Bacteroidales bacterium]
MLKLTILNDNAPGRICGSEHGLSYIIEADKTILFDTSPSDIFLKNAQKLHININRIDTLVLSPG